MRNALVLSGGSIGGAFQAGALRVLLEKGFVPDVVFGVSAGALNGAFLVDRSGRGQAWPAIGRDLESFWRDNVTTTSDVIRKRWPPVLLWRLLWKRFNGLASPDPSVRLLRRTVDVSVMRKSPVAFRVACVDLLTGKVVSADKEHPAFFDHIVASASVPVLTPPVRVHDGFCVDAGIRDIAPLKAAFDAGAGRIVVVACGPDALGGAASLAVGDIRQLVLRIVAIVENELLNNDLATTHKINDALADAAARNEPPPGYLSDKRRVVPQIIRPERDFHVDVMKFGPEDIDRLIKEGNRRAEAVLG